MGAYEWITGASPKRSLDNGAFLVSGAYPRKGPNIKKVDDFTFQFGRRVAEREGSNVSGNGPTIGNALVAGVQSVKKSEVFQYACIIPFKQHGTIADMPHAQRSEYFHQVRQELISKANIIVMISGEKLANNGQIINSDTVFTEYTQALEAGRFPIPIAILGGASATVHDRIKTDIGKRIHPYKDLPAGLFDKLADQSLSFDEVISAVFDLADWIIETKLTPRSRRSSVSSRDGSKNTSRNVSGTSGPSFAAEVAERMNDPTGPGSAAYSRQASYASNAINI